MIAVARSGERLNQKIGDIVLQAGDTLLVEAHPSFADQQRNSHHFYLVSSVEGSSPVNHERAYVALAILLVMILAASFTGLGMLKAAMLAAGAMLFARCCTGAQARRSVEWKVIISVAAAFALGGAVEKSGLAGTFAGSLTHAAGGDPTLSLAAIYGGTLLLTELISHSAAVSLLFPIALNTAATLGIDYMPFVAAVTTAGSLGLRDPARLPDPHDGLQPRRIPFHRFPAHRHPYGYPVRGHRDADDTARVPAGSGLTPASTRPADDTARQARLHPARPCGN